MGSLSLHTAIFDFCAVSTSSDIDIPGPFDGDDSDDSDEMFDNPGIWVSCTVIVSPV